MEQIVEENERQYNMLKDMIATKSVISSTAHSIQGSVS